MVKAVAVLVLLGGPALAAAELPIVDAHIHDSHDAWDVVPPKEAVAILRKAGVKRWWAPTRSCPSAGTTCPSTPPGRAAGWPTCRPTSPSGSPGRTARRCLAVRLATLIPSSRN